MREIVIDCGTNIRKGTNITSMCMLAAPECPKIRMFFVYLDAKGQVKIH